MIFTARDHSIDLSKRPYIMGIVNITPDSFSDGGEYLDVQSAATHARELVEAGADIVDLGAESSRPGAAAVAVEDELARLLPVVEQLVNTVSVPISIDTTKAEVAEACLKAGAHIINDISGFQRDPELPAVVKRYAAGCILMHMRGTSATMQTLTKYHDVISEICSELRGSIKRAREADIPASSIMIDPGVGFAKTAEQNLVVLKELQQFTELGYPLLIGISRKSFIGTVLAHPNPSDREWGTAASVAVAVQSGAQVIRVHDVAHMRDVIRMTHAIMTS